MSEGSPGADRIDWPGLMRLGLGALRLAPDAFWSMSPTELRLALEGAGFLSVEAQLPMNRESLAHLMSAYPDKPESSSEKKE